MKEIKMRNPEEMKLMIDCECGRSVNKAYVEKVIDKIIEDALREERERTEESERIPEDELQSD